MQIKRIDFHKDASFDKPWEIKDLELNNINLIAGYNASGKTRTLVKIRDIANLICGHIKPKNNSESYTIELADANNIPIIYSIEFKNGEIRAEKLIINKEEKLLRISGEEGWIWSEKLKSRLDFSIAPDKAAIYTKQDKIQHPFLESIIQWGINTIFYEFGSELGKDNLIFIKENNSSGYNTLSGNTPGKVIPELKYTDRVVGHLYRGIKKYGKKLTQKIISQMEAIDYFIKDIGVEAFPTSSKHMQEEGSVPRMIYVKEKELPGKTYQVEMSQGMFRALSLIIQTNICRLENRGELIIIDDIGEGLDHNRASKLIREIIKNAEKSSIQLVMATNDRYVMNNVPLKYWQVIRRENGYSRFYNYRNSKEIFDDFKLTGLNNFDFLSSGFYLGENG